MTKFGQNYVFKINASDGDPTLLGALFCYVILLLTTYLGWTIVGKAMGRRRRLKEKKSVPTKDAGSD
jgi:hypothetical protein